MELKVGQKVYLKPCGNRFRKENCEIMEMTILKVGRKYFFVGTGKETSERAMIKFEVGTLKQVTTYSADYALYLTKQEILDKEERAKLEDALRKKFSNYGPTKLSLDQLRRMIAIADEGETTC